MATVYYSQSAFNSGMWGELFHMRTDLENYTKSVADAQDMEVLLHGPIRRRAGTRARLQLSGYAGEVRMIPFILSSQNESYMYVLADGEVHLIKDDDVILESADTIPYGDTDLDDVQYTISGRDVILFHPDYPVQVIRYRSDSAVSVFPFHYQVPPTINSGFSPNMGIILSAATGDITVTTGVGPDDFQETDVGREIQMTTGEKGIAVITAFTNGDTVSASVLEDFDDTTPANGDWKLSGSPFSTIVMASDAEFEKQGESIRLYFGNEAADTELITNGDFSSGITGWAVESNILVNTRDFVAADSSDTRLRDEFGSFLAWGILPGHLVVNDDTNKHDEVIEVTDSENLYVTSGGENWSGGGEQYFIRHTGRVSFDTTEKRAKLYGGVQGTAHLIQLEAVGAHSLYRLKFEVLNEPLVMRIGDRAWSGDIVEDATFPPGKHEVFFPFTEDVGINAELSFLNNKDFEASLTNVSLNELDEPAPIRELAVGDYISLNGGLVRITAIDNTAPFIDGIIEKSLTSRDRAPGGTWNVERALFSAGNGYPRCGAVFNDRLYLSGNDVFPDKLLASRVGNYANFARGTDDSDSFTFGINGIQREPLLWMHAENSLLAGTVDREFAISGLGAPITPTNIDVATPSEIGSSKVQPIRAGNLILFTEFGGGQIREFAFNDNVNAYVSDRNLLVFIEDKLTDAVKRLVYQRRQYPQLYVATDGGDLFVGAYVRTEGVMGWSQWNPNGSVMEVGRQAHDLNDRIWLAVQRSGDTYIEYIDTVDGFYSGRAGLDQSFIHSNITPFTSVTGMIGLVGETVSMLLDGEYIGEVLVDADPFDISTWTSGATSIELGYNFTGSIKLQRPKFENQPSLALSGLQSRVITYVRNTIGGTYVGQANNDVGTAGTTFTGKVITEANTGFNDVEDDSLLIEIEQPEPYPLEVQSVARLISFSDV